MQLPRKLGAWGPGLLDKKISAREAWPCAAPCLPPSLCSTSSCCSRRGDHATPEHQGVEVQLLDTDRVAVLLFSVKSARIQLASLGLAEDVELPGSDQAVIVQDAGHGGNHGVSIPIVVINQLLLDCLGASIYCVLLNNVTRERGLFSLNIGLSKLFDIAFITLVLVDNRMSYSNL